MRIVFIILLQVALCTTLNAQHSIGLSQYSLNAMTINPAFTGIEDFVDIKFGYREQWAGFEDAPSSQFVTANGVITRTDPSDFIHNSLRVSDPSIYDSTEYHTKKRLRHGLGLMLQNENQALFKQSSYLASYSLHLPLNGKLNLALGTSLGLFKRSINTDIDFSVKDKTDALYQALLANGSSQTMFDINMGVLLYSEKFFFGVSALPMVTSDLSKETLVTYDDNLTLVGIAGVRFELDANWSFIPSIVTRIREPIGAGYDINMKLSRLDHLWFGLSYRQNETANINVGVLLSQKYTLGYSYDYSFSDLNSVSSGSHEVVLGVSLLKQNHHRSLVW